MKQRTNLSYLEVEEARLKMRRGGAHLGITPKRRDLMFRVLDGQSNIVYLMYHLNHFRRCDEMLKWLIDHQFTGRVLFSKCKEDFNFSPLNIAKWILKELDREKEIRAVIVGPDFIP